MWVYVKTASLNKVASNGYQQGYFLAKMNVYHCNRQCLLYKRGVQWGSYIHKNLSMIPNENITMSSFKSSLAQGFEIWKLNIPDFFPTTRFV